MKKLLVIVLIFLAGCGAPAHESDTEMTDVVEIATEGGIVAEIATESVSETTEDVSENIRQIIVTAAPQVVRDMKKKHEEVTTEAPTEAKDEAPVPSDGHLTRSGGVYYFNGHKETWYSTNEASGQATAVPIPGKHADSNGIIRDADGYVCVASSDHRIYSIVETSWGTAKVYDTGCSHGTIDLYTTW